MPGNNYSFDLANAFISPRNISNIESSIIVPISRENFYGAIRDFHNSILRNKQKRSLDEVNNIFIEWVSSSHLGAKMNASNAALAFAPTRLATVMFDGDDDMLVGANSFARREIAVHDATDFYMRDMFVDNVPNRNNNQEDILSLSYPPTPSRSIMRDPSRRKPRTVLGIDEGRKNAENDDLSHILRGGEKYQSRIGALMRNRN